MRTAQIIAGIAMLCVAGCAHHEPTANPVDLTPAIASVDNADKSLSRAIKSNDKPQIIKQVQEAKQDLQVVKKNLVDQQALAKQLAETRDWWKNYASQQEEEVVALRKKLVHFNHLLFICASLAGVLAGLVVGRFAMAFSPYGALVGVGAGAVAFGAVWAILAHL